MLQLFQRKARAAGVTGLSLGERHFALAHFSRQRDQITLDRCLRSEMRNQQHLRETLSRQVEELQLGGSECNALLAPRDYNLYLVETPNVEQSEMRAAVRWKIKDMIDMPVDDAVVDVFPLPDDAFQGRNRMVYVVAALKSRIEQMAELCQKVNLQLAAIDIPEMAMRNISTRFANDDNSLAFLSLKSHASSMNITRRGSLYLARKINTPVAADVFESGDWENLRDRLVLEIQRSLDYFESQMGQSPVSTIMLAPRGRDTAMMVRSLNEVLPVKVVALEFGSQLESGHGIDSDLKHSCMLAIGAALRPGSGV